MMERNSEKQEIKLEDMFPILETDTQRLARLPDRMDLLMEDGIIYHVSSFFTGQEQMTAMLDALNLEKIDRTA